MTNYYDARTALDVKQSIIDSFTDADGNLRLVTVAFAMGLDAPNIRHVLHWGPPTDIEMYIQGTGRAGRDDSPAYATLHYNRHDIN